MNAGRLLPLILIVVLFSGCASPRNHREAKAQNDKVSLVIMPVIVVLPNRGANDGDPTPSREDDSHPRALLLRNLQYPAGSEFKHVPETINPGR